MSGWATNYYNNFQLHVITDGSGNVTSYELLKPDGSKIVYAFFRTFSDGTWGEVFMSQQVDPQSHAIQFQYPNYDPAIGIVLLKYVVDADGHRITLNYLADDIYFKNRVGSASDEFGRTASFGIAGYSSGLGNVMTNITDVASMSTSFVYDGTGYPSTMTTPYGTTSLTITEWPYPSTDRRIIINEPATGVGQAYGYFEYCDNPADPNYLPPAYPASQVPTNTPLNTLDNNPQYRNSFHWGRQQFATLPQTFKDTGDFTQLSASDFLKARMRHWLGGANDGDFKPIDTLSIERDFSPDGVTEGQKTWYDYANKGPHGNDDKGTQILPSVVAWVLPDGSTRYDYSQRNGWGIATNMVETYTKTDGSIGTRTTSFGYASNGIDLLTVTNALGVRVSSNYFNAYHQVLTNYNALNQMTIYTYDASLRPATVQTPAGLLTTRAYGADKRLSTIVDSIVGGPSVRTNSYTWNAVGTLLSHTDPRGLTTTHYWDKLLRLTGILYPDNTTISNIYTYLDVTASKDRLSHWTYFGFNAIRQRIAETNVNNVVTRYGYCDCGALRYVTNAFGVTGVQEVTSFNYDYQGNRTYIFYPDGTTVTNWFDSLRRPSATGDGIGVRWFGYNNQGLLTSITNAAGVEQRSVFDIVDRVYSMTDANGVAVTTTYDNLDRLRTRTYPDGGVEAFGYTANIIPATSYTNQVQKVWTYAYDAAVRKTNEVGVGVYTNSFTYKPADDLATLKDGKNQMTTWNYDLYGRVTNKLDQANVEILRYSYDANSRLTNRWSIAKGNTAYTYDNLGNLTFVNYPLSQDITLQYDALNRLTNMVDAAGTTAFTYYAGGLLKTEDGPWASDTVTYTYNSRMRASLNLQQPSGSWAQNYYYDAAHRLGTNTSPAGTFIYAYQGSGKLVKKLSLPNSSYITNTYDNVARLTGTYLDNSSNTILDKSEYLYNAGNQRIRQMRTDGSYYTNNYDNIGQLTWADSTVSLEDRGYLYDAAWNLNVRTNNGLTSTFTVDNKNQLVTTPSGSCVYDSNGNLTSDPSRTFSYDDENQLTQVIYPNSTRVDLTYDGRMRLRKRTEYTWNGTSWTSAGETGYVYDGMRVIQERNSSNTPTVGYTRGVDLSGTYEGAGGIGGLEARSHGYSAGSWTTHHFYHADGGGNITAMVDSTQVISASYRYEPSGNLISSGGSMSSTNIYRFSSKEWLPSANLYYYGFRFFDPSLQRWLNRDPLGEYGGLNLYTSLYNDAANWIDTDGRLAVMPARPIVGRLIGGIGRLIGGAVASPIGTAIVVGTVGAIIIDKGSDILYPDPGSAPLPLPKDRVHKPKPKPNPFPKPKPHIRPNCEQYDPNNDEHEKKEAKCLQELAEWLQWMSELGMPEMTQPEKIKFLQDCMEREGVDGYMGGGGGSY